MNRPIYTRFSKIISTDEIHPSYIKEIKKEQKLYYFFGEGPATEAFYRNFFKILTILLCKPYNSLLSLKLVKS